MVRAPLIGVVALALVVSACGGRGHSPPAHGPSARLTASIPAPGYGWVAVGKDAVWVATSMANGNRELRRIDPDTNRVEARVRLSADAQGLPEKGLGTPIAAGESGVWASGADASLVRVDPHSMQLATVALPRGASPGPIAIAFGSVWVIDLSVAHWGTYGTLYRIDPRSGRIMSSIRSCRILRGRAYCSGWLHLDDGRRHPEDRSGHRKAAHRGPLWVRSIRRWEPDFVWFAGCLTLDPERRVDRLVRVSVHSNTATEIPRGRGQYIESVTVGFGSVWVLHSKPLLERLDPKTGSVLGRMALPATAVDAPGIAIGFGSIFVRARDRVLRLEPRL